MIVSLGFFCKLDTMRVIKKIELAGTFGDTEGWL